MMSAVDEHVNKEGNLFNRAETSILCQVFFKNAHTYARQRALSFSEFRNCIADTFDFTNPRALDGLTRAASSYYVNGERKYMRTVSLWGFLRVLSVMMRGDIESKATLVFEVLDVDGDGLLQGRKEMERLVEHCYPSEDWEAARDFRRYISTLFEFSPKKPITLERFLKLASEKPDIVDAALPVSPNPLTAHMFETLFGTHQKY